MIAILSMDDLYKKLTALSEDELILDVRTPGEFSDGHVPGSRNIPHEQVADFAGELKNYRKIYIYCRSGRRVEYALHELERAGLINLEGVIDGGMPDWIACGYPVER
ncbi:MAG: rhodanese-like domain-containing protein [Bdellovibrionota bacterium]